LKIFFEPLLQDVTEKPQPELFAPAFKFPRNLRGGAESLTLICLAKEKHDLVCF
jgi:hypothetical protein